MGARTGRSGLERDGDEVGLVLLKLTYMQMVF